MVEIRKHITFTVGDLRAISLMEASRSYTKLVRELLRRTAGELVDAYDQLLGWRSHDEIIGMVASELAGVRPINPMGDAMDDTLERLADGARIMGLDAVPYCAWLQSELSAIRSPMANGGTDE